MLTVLKTALEVGLIYGLVALALFISFSILNIADLSTDGCFTLGCAVGAMLTIAVHPLLALPAAMAAGMLSGFITAFLQTRLGVESILAGIISNTGLYTINLAVMGFSSNVSITGRDTVFSLFKALTGGSQWSTLVLLALALSGYGMREALRVPPVREVRMQVPGLPDALNGFRIAQLSDLHIGPTFGKAWLTDVVARTDSLNPDLIVITGDVVDGSPSRLEEDVAPLADLKAKYGVIFAPGNHEYYSGIQQWLPVFQRLGMHVLMNENTQIRVNGTPFAIAGVTDTAALNWGLEGPDPEKALSGLSKDITKLMLSHRPSLAPESAKAGASLQLSGHTHGGRILTVTHIIGAFSGGYVSGH